MAEIIRMPKMSDTMEEGVIAAWLKKVGDEVKAGDILAEVETDKATMELESYEEGVLLYIGVQEKDAVPVNGVIAIVGEKGENIDDLLKEIQGGGSASSESNSKTEDSKEAPASEDTEEGHASEEIDTSDIKATLITMPKMSDTMQEGTIAAWLKKEGDEVKSGDILAEVETDKATMELESYEDGVLLHIGVAEGDSVEIDGVIAVIGEKGADFEKLLQAHKAKSSAGTTTESKPKAEKKEPPAEEKSETAVQKESGSSSSSTDGRVKASPLAKRLADDKGIDISLVKGTGEGGRIIKRDVENFDPARVKAPAAAASGVATAIGQE